MSCKDCPPAAEPKPVFWDRARVWLSDDRTVDVGTLAQWTDLSDDVLGVVGVRENGSTDWLSGVDWYGWVLFSDGTWRISGIMGSHDEMLRVHARYPGSVWKEGRLVSDAEMQLVTDAMGAFVGSLR
jgi:hypothetical protein